MRRRPGALPLYTRRGLGSQGTHARGPRQGRRHMSDDLPLDREFSAAAEECAAVSPLVRRIVADNPGPFTFKGTCSYVVGTGKVAIIDPGPDLPGHVEALLAAVRHET